jgi:hypothetical protein
VDVDVEVADAVRTRLGAVYDELLSRLRRPLSLSERIPTLRKPGARPRLGPSRCLALGDRHPRGFGSPVVSRSRA